MVSSISLSIDADLDKVSLIARAVRALCAEILHPDDVDAVELGLVEAINNVIEHGYHGQPGKNVQVRVGLQSDQVVIEIVDHAPPMPADLLQSPTSDPFGFDENSIEGIPEGGMGLALIRMNMDEVEYFSSEGENRLRMVKRVRA
jgi:serine/threonine-protein kinase RsbW